ncbi:MAG: hypothetical protein GY835_12470 [bacterium]|nr:hypothetical protein [bacterium]
MMSRIAILSYAGRLAGLVLILLFLLMPLAVVAQEGKAIPDTTKMSPLQLLAWRAKYAKTMEKEVAEEDGELPAGVTRITDSDGSESCPVWSPDGRYLYYGYSHARVNCINRIDLTTMEIKAVTDSTYYAQMPDISPDGQHMSFNQKMMGIGVKLWVMRLEDGAIGKLTTSEDSNRETWSRWSRDGMKIYFLDTYIEQPKTYCASSILRTGTNPKKIMQTEQIINRPNVSCAGDRIAWSCNDGDQSSIRLINLDITAIYEDIVVPGYYLSCADWLPGDERMIVSYLDKADPMAGFNLGILDIFEQRIIPLLDLGMSESEPQISPDGSQVVFQASIDGKQSDIFIFDLK